MKKILFIHHATGWGGAPKSMIQLINALDKEKYDAHVLLIKDSIVSKKLKESNINYSIAQSKFYKNYYHYFTHSEAGYVKWYQIIRFIRFSVSWLFSRYYFAKRELERYDYDIYYLNSSCLTDWLAPAKKKGKVIIHIREPFRKGHYDLLYYFFRWQMRKYADHIIAISKDNARRINVPEKTTVIYNFADLSKTEVDGKSYYSKKFLYIGGAARRKGFYTLIDALDYLHPDIMIYFGGSYEGTKKSGFKARIKQTFIKIIPRNRKKERYLLKLKAHPCIRIIGMVDNVGDYLDEVCCLISPFSTPHFARPVIEAHLRKKPAIGSDVPGMDEIINNGTTGLLFQRENAKDLAQKINYIAYHPHEAKKMGETAYNIAKKKFSPKNVIVIEDLLKKI